MSTVLSCPSCGAPITVRARFCAYCRAPLSFGGALSLERGANGQRVDLTRGFFLPGSEGLDYVRSVSGTGLVFSFKQSMTTNGTVAPACTDQSVLASGTCHDAFGAFGVMLRVTDIGSSRAGYMLVVRPAHQRWSVVCFVNTKAGLNVETIESRTHDAISGVDQPNTVELRAADSWFEVVLNGVRAWAFEHAAYGFGLPGWHATAYGAARITLSRFEAVDLL